MVHYETLINKVKMSNKTPKSWFCGPILITWCILLLLGCKTKEKYITSIERVTDSIYIKTESIINPPILSSLIINELCDSVTNKPVQFKKVFVIDGDSIEILTNKNNQLEINIKQLERLLSKKDSVGQFHSKDKEVVSKTIVTNTKRPWKLIGFFILVIVSFIVFPVVPKFLNGMVRKLIRF